MEDPGAAQRIADSMSSKFGRKRRFNGLEL
ncbi:hypothetical protein [Sporolactobacillus pectinivorans]